MGSPTRPSVSASSLAAAAVILVAGLEGTVEGADAGDGDDAIGRNAGEFRRRSCSSTPRITWPDSVVKAKPAS